MILTKNLIPLPSRKIIVDLALRSGLPDEESTCPYQGRADHIREVTNEEQFSIINLISKQDDYNANKQKPSFGTYINTPKGSREASSSWPIRMEEIDPSWVYKWLDNILYNVREHRKDSIKEERSKHGEIRTWDDEDGDIVSETDLLMDKPKYSLKEIESWKEELPYVLKRLHSKSKDCGYSIMSLIIAYEKERIRIKNTGKKANVQPNQVVGWGIYKMNSQGYIPMNARVPDNKKFTHTKLINWIKGDPEHTDAYFKDAMRLLHICKLLDIDIRNEDPYEFQEDYISSLVVLYITNNRDFILPGVRNVNTLVLKELKNIPLEDYGRIIDGNSKINIHSVAENKMQQFIDSRYEVIQRDRNLQSSVWTFGGLYKAYSGTDLDLPHRNLRDGFYLAKKSQRPLLIDVTSICRGLSGDQNFQLIGQVNAIIHCDGYLVLVHEDDELYFLDIRVAIEYLYDEMKGIKRDRYQMPEAKMSNHSFGKWLSTML